MSARFQKLPHLECLPSNPALQTSPDTTWRHCHLFSQQVLRRFGITKGEGNMFVWTKFMQLLSDVHPPNVVRFGNLLVQLMRSDGLTTFAVRPP